MTKLYPEDRLNLFAAQQRITNAILSEYQESFTDHFEKVLDVNENDNVQEQGILKTGKQKPIVHLDAAIHYD